MASYLLKQQLLQDIDGREYNESLTIFSSYYRQTIYLTKDMVSVTDVIKRRSFLGIQFWLLLLGSLSLLSCKVTETTIQPIVDSNTTWVANHDSIYVMCSMHYLKHFDTIQGSKKSRFASDAAVAKTIVYNALNQLYSGDSLILKKFVCCTTPSEIRSDTAIDIQIHTFINWWDMIPMIKVRESVCVRSALVCNEKVIQSHEEWGYRRTLGEFYDVSTAYGDCEIANYQLKLYCIQKSIVELLKAE